MLVLHVDSSFVLILSSRTTFLGCVNRSGKFRFVIGSSRACACKLSRNLPFLFQVSVMKGERYEKELTVPLTD